MGQNRKSHTVAAVEDALLRCARARGSVARSDLSQELGLVPSTIGVYVERLVRDGFLLETVAPGRSLGRPPVLLELNPNYGRFLGIDYDARNLAGITIDFSQQPLHRARRTLPARPTFPQIMAAIESLAQELIAGDPASVLGIGIGMPGIIDPQAGEVIRCNVVPESRRQPIVAPLEERLGIPVSIENNLRSLALAEYWFGQGRGVARLACLGVRTGIGLGIVVNGELYRGATNVAGEIGMWICPEVKAPAVPGGLPEIVTTPRTLEEVASVEALLNAAAAQLRHGVESQLGSAGTIPTWDTFTDAVHRDDTLAVELVRGMAVQHAWLAHHLVLTLDPDLIMLASPLTELAEYMRALRATCRELGETLHQRIIPSELGSYGAAKGAAAIAVHNWSPRRNELSSDGSQRDGDGQMSLT